MTYPPDNHCWDCWQRGIASLLTTHEAGSDCAACGYSWKAPRELYYIVNAAPDDWPTKGYREKLPSGKTRTLTAHDLRIRQIREGLKLYRTEYLTQRSPEVAELENFLRQRMLF